MFSHRTDTQNLIGVCPIPGMLAERMKAVLVEMTNAIRIELEGIIPIEWLQRDKKTVS